MGIAKPFGSCCMVSYPAAAPPRLFGQFCSVSQVYRILVSCCFLLFQSYLVHIIRRLPIKGGLEPFDTVEGHRFIDCAPGLEAVGDLLVIDGLLLQ